MDFVSGLCSAQDDRPASALAVVAGTVVATTAVLSLARYTLWPAKLKVIPGPLQTTIPYLSEEELKLLEYPPDAFPGARDVLTPYGSMRVYEWGPEAGPKVLFIHGISTSCQTLGKLAHGLVAKGCRVMLFDLFGRGFTDGVGDLPHDARLYVSQALLAMASSPLPWTGAGALNVVGYSMGGGIAVHLAAAFPDMVASLVLLAPAGLIRPANFGSATRFIFTSGLVPDALLARLTKARLQQPIAAGRVPKSTNTANTTNNNNTSDKSSSHDHHHHTHKKQDPVTASLSEAADEVPLSPLERRVLKYVHWMLAHHAGFVPAFMACVRDAPLTGQQAAWSRLAARAPGTTAVVLGRADEIVDADDYATDALPLLGGKERVRWIEVAGGHDFPMTHAEEVVAEIGALWGI